MYKVLALLIIFSVNCLGADALLKYQVTPKLIDSNRQETSLDAFTISGVANTFSNYKTTIVANSSNSALPIVTNQLIVEFESNTPVTFGIWTDSDVFISSYTLCSNFIVNGTSNNVYKVTTSSVAANIVWRQGK